MMARFKKRYEATVAALPEFATRPAAALRAAMRESYGFSDLRADLLAGIVVGIVALPLSMALAIASGVPPQHGLYTAVIAGGLVALLGGSRTQVSGPTAAFVVILAPISATYGLAGLCLATVMAGILLLLMGLARLGRLIQFIPYPVVTGFTSGIAIVIATLQVRDFLGLQLESVPSHFIERAAELGKALPSARWEEMLLGGVTLALLLLWPRITRRVPAPLIALTVAALLAIGLSMFMDGFEVATIRSRFTTSVGGVEVRGVPQLPPLFVLPWNLPGPEGGMLHLDFDTLRMLAASALAIAMLGGIESLLSAVVADGMTGHRHDPDAELIAQGIGNIAAPFFGGFAATGAIARTATNIRSGARSPIAAMFHALFVLLAVLLLAPMLGYLPMSSLAALLLVVAWNMSEAKHVVHMVRVAPRSDVLVLLTCLSLTVIFDMVIAVSVGVVLAALLFMRRMAEISGAKLIDAHALEFDEPLPTGLVVYEIAGPLFFGAASKAMSALHDIHVGVKAVVLDMRSVPAMDATGLVNLESAVARMRHRGVLIVLGGIQPQPASVLRKAGFAATERNIEIRREFPDALALARAHVASTSETASIVAEA